MKNKENLEPIVPNVKVLNALRNSGYNNYTAIADIIDNSLEKEVETKNIYIILPDKKQSFNFIKICDDGCGMDYITLKDAVTLGSLSPKNLTTDLGAYGTGLKSASLSMGQRLIVKTKSKNDDFYIAVFDIEELYKKNIWQIPIISGSDEEYIQFKDEIKSETGTIIEISKLDRLKNHSIDQFKNLLKKRLGLTFKYFIEEKNVSLFINDVKVEPLDPMLRNKHYSIRLCELNDTFEYNNKKYIFNAYYLDKKFKNEIDETGLIRNEFWSGLYIYRNLRLVGEHVGLGVWGKGGDGYSNGGRIEIFIDGEDDNLFASSFNKIITEKDQNDINQGFRDTLKKVLDKYQDDVRKRDHIKHNEDKQPDDEQKKVLEDIIKGINANKALNVPKLKGQNEKSDIENSEIKHPRGKQENPNPHKKRNDAWLAGGFAQMGEYGKVFDIRLENGFHNVIINTDHVFWLEFLHKASHKTLEMFIKWFSSSSIALQSSIYDPSIEEYETADLMDIFHERLSKELRTMILH